MKYTIDYGYGEAILYTPYDAKERFYTLAGTCFGIRKSIMHCVILRIVRCKDCHWRGSEECAMFYRCGCGEQHTWETDDDFCSYGEKL